jgi:DNA-binding transcriptional ArsR family regulator
MSCGCLYEAPAILVWSMNADLDTQLNFTMIALSDPTRRAILERLARGEACVTDVAQPFEISLNAVSKHLKILERAGLVRREIRGRNHVLHFEGERLAEAAEWMATMQRFWEDRLDALERVLRERKAQAGAKRGG